MASKLEILADKIAERFGNSLTRVESTVGELTYEVKPGELLDVCRVLRDEEPFAFEQLMDVCGVDYLAYGKAEWLTQEATDSGFSRGVNREPWKVEQKVPRRFAVVYHLLSIKHNHRLRLRVFCAEDRDPPVVESVTGIWASANWFEREAFDLYGILFANHPDLRRILTDYGFVGHPFRKDFPLIGNVEVRYDPEKGRVVYQPTSIEPRTLVPKVIRDDHRNEPAFKESSDNA